MAAKTKRISAGYYQLLGGSRNVLIVRVDEWSGKWHWRDVNDIHCYGDPVATKADAIREGESYMANREANPEQWR